MISFLIEVCLIKGDGVVIIIIVEIKVFISIICKIRVIDFDIRVFKIYVRFLCFCMVIVKICLIDSDIIGCIKIECGFIIISV